MSGNTQWTVGIENVARTFDPERRPITRAAIVGSSSTAKSLRHAAVRGVTPGCTSQT
jgi:hypothetical protein